LRSGAKEQLLKEEYTCSKLNHHRMARGKAGCAERSGLPRPNVPFGTGGLDFFRPFFIKEKRA
ncbi:hypothetical protein ABTD84_19755, partial [Acinetobacter baumannii]